MSPEHQSKGEGQSSHAIWCEGCGQHHGSLFLCKHYDKDFRAKLLKEGRRFRQAVADGSAFPADTPNAVKTIFGLFAEDIAP